MASKETILASLQDLGMSANGNVLDRCLELCESYQLDSEEFVDTWCSFAASNITHSELNLNNLLKLERKALQNRKHKEHSFRKDPDYENPAKDDKLENSFSNTVEESPIQVVSTQNSNFSSADLNKTLTDYDAASEMNKYIARADSRKILHKFGEAVDNFHRSSNLELTVKDLKQFNDKFVYMYEIMGAKAQSVGGLSQWLGEEILKAHNLTATEVLLKNFTGQVTTFGRVLSDSNGKLNVNSMYLEVTHGPNLGYVVKMNLNKCNSIALFSGQTIVVEGNHMLKPNLLAVERIFSSAPLEPTPESLSLQSNLEIVVAAGPFTLLGNINYDPLNDLLKYVVEYKPHVLMLIGPFISENHDNINDGAFFKSFEAVFEDIVETIMSQLQEINVKIIIVASHRDVVQHPIYPTPPYKFAQKYENLHFVCDPCMVNVDGLVIGATSVDTLLDISNFSLLQNASNDRFGSLCKLLLDQQSFYPLYPPQENLNIDHDLGENYLMMDYKPHILVLPSTFRCFVKNVNNCLVINPERLTKGYAAGTFARIQIKPGTNVSNQTCCQILRI